MHTVFEIDMNWVYYYLSYYDNILVPMLICVVFYSSHSLGSVRGKNETHFTTT